MGAAAYAVDLSFLFGFGFVEKHGKQPQMPELAFAFSCAIPFLPAY